MPFISRLSAGVLRKFFSLFLDLPACVCVRVCMRACLGTAYCLCDVCLIEKIAQRSKEATSN